MADRFREVLLHGKWIANTNYQEQLSQVKWQQATHQVGSLNTIAALTYHVNYYVAGVLNVFEGGALEISDRYSFDLPEINSPEAWKKLTDELLANAEAYAAHVERMPAEKLAENFVDEKYGSYRRNIEGMIEHCYYHLGQISLLRKMITSVE